MIASTTQSRLRGCLSGVEFPASKEDLLEGAARNGGDAETVQALRTLAPVTYTNLAQVAASVTMR